MKKITPRKKLKSKTPIVFALSAKDKAFIKQIPQKSVTRLCEGIGDPTDWYNTVFRTHVGYGIAKIEYDEETIKEMQTALEYGEVILKANLDNDVYVLTDEQKEWLKAAVDATDVMTDATTRRVLLDASLNTRSYMKKLTSKYNINLQ